MGPSRAKSTARGGSRLPTKQGGGRLIEAGREQRIAWVIKGEDCPTRMADHPSKPTDIMWR